MPTESNGRPTIRQMSWGTTTTILVVGIVIGTVISWALLFGPVDTSTTQWVNSTLHLLMLALGVCCATLVVAIPGTLWVLTKFLSSAKGSLDQIVTEIRMAAQAQHDGHLPAVVDHAQRALLEALAWYAPRAVRRWIVQTSFGLLIALGGLAGTALVFRQTVLLGEQNKKLQEQISLLKQQNDKLDLQTITSEVSQRRSMLTAELFSLLQLISSNGAKPFDDGTAARVVSFTQAATPYFSLEIEENSSGQRELLLAKRPRSIERGQLLSALVSTGASVPTTALFASADLRGVNFQKRDLRSISLPGADLKSGSLVGANFTEANLERANLKDANAVKTSFTSAKLRGADLRSANLQEANFNNATLRDANFYQAFLFGATLERATIDGATFKSANLAGAKLNAVNNSSRSGGTFVIGGGDDFGPPSAKPSLNMRDSILVDADFTDAVFPDDVDWEGARVGSPGQGQLPDGFPKGWTEPPKGWKIVASAYSVHLKRADPEGVSGKEHK